MKKRRIIFDCYACLLRNSYNFENDLNTNSVLLLALLTSRHLSFDIKPIRVQVRKVPISDLFNSLCARVCSRPAAILKAEKTQGMRLGQLKPYFAQITKILTFQSRFLVHSTAVYHYRENMSIREENWQTKKPTIRERTKFMFNNDLFSDVKFVVRKSDGESESKQAIPAHKLMLSIGSPVFEAMFYGELAEPSDSIELPDCEYESLLELFRYLYSDGVNLSGSNVMEVLYLAKKYIVPSLAVKCTEYLQDHLDPSNVFNILQSARKYDEEQLMDRCWEVIDKQTEASVESEGFAVIDRPLLEELVQRDTLNIPEVELFKGVVQWAEKEVARRGIVADGREKRNVIGERIIKAIRFPIMKQDEFAAVVTDSRILSYDEICNLIKHFNSVGTSPVEFPVSKRSGSGAVLLRCGRFNLVKFGWQNAGTQRIGFKVNRDIRIHGVNFFGSQGNTYRVLDLLISNSSFGYVSLSSTTGEFSSVLNKSKEFYSFDVRFRSPITLIKDVNYLLEARIIGPTSFYGVREKVVVVCSGVAFEFIDFFPDKGSNINPKAGQFNEIIFSFVE